MPNTTLAALVVITGGAFLGKFVSPAAEAIPIPCFNPTAEVFL